MHNDMSLPIALFVFIASIFFLVKSADYFTTYSEKVGRLMHMPAFIVGIVIVAVGTSLPELATSLMAVMQQHSDIVVGNVVGSNVTNILLGIGFTMLVTQKIFKAEWNIFFGDYTMLIAGMGLIYFAAHDGVITFAESLLFISGYVVYLFYAYGVHKTNHEVVVHAVQVRKQLVAAYWAALLASLVVIFLSSRYTILSVVAIAQALHIGTEVLATSVVALGTSFPEIFVAISAARKGKFDLLAGDIIGSNIFNTYVIIVVSGIVVTLIIPSSLIAFAIPFAIFTTIMYWVILQDHKILPSEGAILTLLYVVFIVKLFNWF